jgi:hypothetical protein
MTIEQSLKTFASKVDKAKSLRRGVITFRLAGKEGGEFYIDSTKGGAQVAKGAPPRIRQFELIGDAGRIAAILDGKKDARKLFLAGGFRIRGDLRYASELAVELGIVKEAF